MGDSLHLYLNNRLEKQDKHFSPEDILPGPVVTISREVGCGGLKMGKKLAAKLNKRKGSQWKVFSKEIFEETARELEMDKEKLSKILKTEGRNTFDEILAALGDKRFKSERRIRKAVIEAIRTIAINGYCIIVGRGGHLITRDIKNSLHIRLSAPLDWRIKKIAKNHGISAIDSKLFIEKTEKERERVRKNICPDIACAEQFDINLNVAAFSGKDIIQLLDQIMLIKGLVKAPKKEVNMV